LIAVLDEVGLDLHPTEDAPESASAMISATRLRFTSELL